MTRRSMHTGDTPHIVIRSNGNVNIQGLANAQVVVETEPEQDAQLKRRTGGVEIQLSGDGQVRVPAASRIELYCGGSAEIDQVAGPVSAFASHDLRLRRVQVLAQASAGGSLEIDCQAVDGQRLRFTAGSDLRCRIRGLESVRYLVNDLAGRREQRLGDGQVLVQLTAGGEVSLPPAVS